MIDSVEIRNFRGIHHGFIENFSRVNLFFGKNNCGKSSLLEGLFLVCGQSNPLLMASINAMRAYDRMSESDIPFFFYKMDVSNEIKFETTGSQERHLAISSFQEATMEESASVSTEMAHHYGLRLKFGTREGEFSSEVVYNIGTSNQIEQRARVDDRYKELLKCVFLSPRYDSNAASDGLHNIIVNKDESFLAEAFKVLEPNATNPIFLGNVMYVDIGLPQRIPINLMGDGIRKIVSFLTSIYACPGGVVLIDELSNGFHYSVMKPMWEIVIRAAIKNDVQIFASTHDVDSIRGFQEAALKVYSETGQEVAAGFKLQRINDDELKAYRFTINQLGNAIDNNTEIR